MDLTPIVESFMTRWEQEGGKAVMDQAHSNIVGDGRAESFRGQYIGFFNTISKWLASSAKNLGGNLDDVDEWDLVAHANIGLNYDRATGRPSVSVEA